MRKEGIQGRISVGKRLAVLKKNMLKEWPRRLSKKQTKIKIKTAK